MAKSGGGTIIISRDSVIESNANLGSYFVIYGTSYGICAELNKQGVMSLHRLLSFGLNENHDLMVIVK